MESILIISIIDPLLWHNNIHVSWQIDKKEAVLDNAEQSFCMDLRLAGRCQDSKGLCCDVHLVTKVFHDRKRENDVIHDLTTWTLHKKFNLEHNTIIKVTMLQILFNI